MPDGRLGRDHTAHTAASLSTAHPVTGQISRGASAHTSAELTVYDAGER